jgi:YegS/Rv2252/BmrU family lipid kinase
LLLYKRTVATVPTDRIYFMQVITEKNIAIVCNPLAGAGRSISLADALAEKLKDRNIGYTIFKEAWPPHFDSFTDVFISGGDGTLNFFINKYPEIKLPLSIFKGGTGNDFHWLLYGNKTMEEQLEAVLQSEAKPIDIGKCNGHYFINGIGVGFEGEVAKALTGKKKRPGKTSFLLTILKKIFTYHSNTYSIRSAEQTLTGKKLLVDISNGRRAGGGFHIAPGAEADDGLFDIVIVDALNTLQRLRYLPVIEKGKHLHLPFIHHFRTVNIIVESNELIQFHLDGEYHESQKVEVQILPGALNFRF